MDGCSVSFNADTGSTTGQYVSIGDSGYASAFGQAARHRRTSPRQTSTLHRGSRSARPNPICARSGAGPC